MVDTPDLNDGIGRTHVYHQESAKTWGISVSATSHEDQGDEVNTAPSVKKSQLRASVLKTEKCLYWIILGSYSTQESKTAPHCSLLFAHLPVSFQSLPSHRNVLSLCPMVQRGYFCPNFSYVSNGN